MTHPRDEIVNELQSFYEFLVGLYLPDNAIKRPPPGGWPHLTPAKLGFLEKNETVIDLLRHLPYLRTDSEDEPLMIYNGCICNDYSDESFLHAESPLLVPLKSLLDDKTSFLSEPHMVTIARANPCHAGFHIFCDTRDGTMVLIDLMDGKRRQSNVKEFFDKLKTEYRTLAAIPIGTQKIVLCYKTFLSSDQLAQLRQIYMKHGWLSSWFCKEQCTVEVERFWDSTLTR